MCAQWRDVRNDMPRLNVFGDELKVVLSSKLTYQLHCSLSYAVTQCERLIANGKSTAHDSAGTQHRAHYIPKLRPGTFPDQCWSEK